MTDDRPDYGTPPEPKYGRRTSHLIGTPDESGRTERELTPDQKAMLRKALGLEPRREVVGIILAIAFIVFGSGMVWLTLQGGWWLLLWVVAGPSILFGAVGLAHDIPRVPRDEKGNRIL